MARAIPRVAEQCRRRVRAGERRAVAHIDPGPGGVGLALGQHRHRRVVALQTIRRQQMSLDQVVQRLQRHSTRAHLVGQRRQSEIDPFARVAIPLPVQRYVLPVLLEEDRRQQVRGRPAARCRVRGRGAYGKTASSSASSSVRAKSTPRSSRTARGQPSKASSAAGWISAPSSTPMAGGRLRRSGRSRLWPLPRRSFQR